MSQLKYELSSSQLKRLFKDADRVSGPKGIRRFERDPRHVELFTKWSPPLIGALQTEPARGEGTWSNPTLSDCETAFRVIAREVTRFVDEPESKIASAKAVQNDLDELAEILSDATTRIGRFKKRTIVWMGEHLLDAHERALYDMGMPTSASPTVSYDMWSSRLTDLAAEAAELRQSYPIDREKHSSASRRRLYRRVILTWFDVTGCWPVISKNAVKPDSLVSEYDAADFEEKKKDVPPPALFVLQLMVRDLSTEKEALLKAKTFEDAVAELRQDALRRAERPPRRRPQRR